MAAAIRTRQCLPRALPAERGMGLGLAGRGAAATGGKPSRAGNERVSDATSAASHRRTNGVLQENATGVRAAGRTGQRRDDSLPGSFERIADDRFIPKLA